MDASKYLNSKIQIKHSSIEMYFFLYIPDAMPDYSLEACKLLSNKSSKKYNLKPLNKTAANPQLKFRNLKGSSISSNQMRF